MVIEQLQYPFAQRHVPEEEQNNLIDSAKLRRLFPNCFVAADQNHIEMAVSKLFCYSRQEAYQNYSSEN